MLAIKLRHITCVLILLVTVQNFEAQVSLLDRRITQDFVNKKVSKVIHEIGELADVGFSYNFEIIEDKKVTYYSNNHPIKYILNNILNSDTVIYRFEEFENHIIILKTDDSLKLDKIVYVSEENVKTIKGLVVEKDTDEPIPFAHVYFKDRNTRTITNIEGVFELNIVKPTNTDTLEISFMGYETYQAPLNEIDSGKNTFKLTPYSFQIEEVVVTPIDPIKIIQQALKNIPENYDKTPSVLFAFFRETNKLNNKYISISEAVLSIYKSNYAINYDRDMVKIMKGRKSRNLDLLEDYDFKVIGGLYYNLKLDIVKDRVSFINPDFFNKYNYEYSKTILINSRPTLVILFDQKNNQEELLYQGKLYIDSETKAIVGSDFRISPKAIDNAGNYLVRKKPNSAKISPVYSHYRTEYIYRDEKWLLSSVKSEIHLNVLNKKTNKFSRFSSLSEFVVTDKHTKEVRKFKRREISKPNDVFVDQVSNDFDKNFWGKYNIIQPDKSLFDAYKELNKNHYLFIINRED